MRIASNVHLLASGRLGCSISHPADCNVYAFRSGSSYCIVDAGVGQQTEFIFQELRRDQIEPDRVVCLLLTHGHLDHSGGAAALHSQLHLPVYASQLTAEALENADEEAISLAAAKRAGIYDETFYLEPCPVERILDDRSTFLIEDSKVTVLQTPGHSQDMLSFLFETPEGDLLFPGDTVFDRGRVLVSPVWDCNPSAYADSLRRLSGLAIHGLYPGHGIWITRDAARHLQSSVRYLEQLLLPPNILTGEA